MQTTEINETCFAGKYKEHQIQNHGGWGGGGRGRGNMTDRWDSGPGWKAHPVLSLLAGGGGLRGVRGATSSSPGKDLLMASAGFQCGGATLKKVMAVWNPAWGGLGSLDPGLSHWVVWLGGWAFEIWKRSKKSKIIPPPKKMLSFSAVDRDKILCFRMALSWLSGDSEKLLQQSWCELVKQYEVHVGAVWEEVGS